MGETTSVAVFPLIRQISRRLSPVLVRLPVSANQVTTASLLVGCGACWYMTKGTYQQTLIGAVLLFLCYVLDNTDGEVARAKDQCTEFGRQYDNFVDWIVHSGFFAGLGWGVARETGQDFWFWLGLFGAAGATINYFLVIYPDLRSRGQTIGPGDPNKTDDPEEPPMPEGVKQWFAFALRELSRADFCFIVLALALFDLTWILLPTAAIGAHAYWLAQFVRGARSFRV